MEWQIAVGVLFIVMTLATGIMLGGLLFGDMLKNRILFFWIFLLCLVVFLTGIVSILSILIVNIY